MPSRSGHTLVMLFIKGLPHDGEFAEKSQMVLSEKVKQQANWAIFFAC